MKDMLRFKATKTHPAEVTILPIDGYHRIAKGDRLKMGRLPAVILTEAESNKVRVR